MRLAIVSIQLARSLAEHKKCRTGLQHCLFMANSQNWHRAAQCKATKLTLQGMD